MLILMQYPSDEAHSSFAFFFLSCFIGLMKFVSSNLSENGPSRPLQNIFTQKVFYLVYYLSMRGYIK